MRNATVVAPLLAGCWLAAYAQAVPSPRDADVSGLEVFPQHPKRDLVIRACAPCHVPELVVAKRHTAEEWDDIILTMIDRGAIATDDEQLEILDYLLRFFGPASSDAPK